MGKFLKYVFAAMFGVLLALGVLVVIGVIIASYSVSSSQGTVAGSVMKGSVLHIQLDGEIVDQDKETDFMDLSNLVMGVSKGNAIGLNVLTKAIRKAAQSDKIAGIFLETVDLNANPAAMQALHRELVNFKKSGKFIAAYADSYSQGEYYVCSPADKLILNPQGALSWKGLASRPMFFKNVFEKLGVKVNVFKVGTYKSAVEPFINTEMSPANREQVTSFLGSIWNNMVKDVAEVRKLSVDSLQAYADCDMELQPVQEYVNCGLVDTLMYVDEAKAALKQLCGIGESDKLKLVSPLSVAEMKMDSEKKKSGKVAVYYASGEIFTSSPDGMDIAKDCILASDVIRDAEKLSNDDEVKAVVLRINSPGGDAYASEQIWHAFKKLGEKKPLVVSMSDYAASGGYYMAVAGKRIFAEPMTLTGSIGIFGLMFDASELLTKKVGLTFDVVKTNNNSDFLIGNFMQPIEEKQAAKIQAYVERGYALFMSRVAEGRGMTTAQVDSIGQGRVWTGEQALRIGLVDELGGLVDAVEYAAKQAGIEKDYEVEESPLHDPWYVSLMGEVQENYFEQRLRGMSGEAYEAYRALRLMQAQSHIQARMPFNPNIQ